MVQRTTDDIQFPAPPIPLHPQPDALTPILREGAQRLLKQAIEAEVDDYIQGHASSRDQAGHRLVVRNGYKDEREIQTGIGPIAVRQPRVNDKRVDEKGQRLQFTSAILPPYLRKTRSIEELIPWLYLKGISTGDFSEASAAGTRGAGIVRIHHRTAQAGLAGRI
jgi:hypothetical protein